MGPREDPPEEDARKLKERNKIVKESPTEAEARRRNKNVYIPCEGERESDRIGRALRKIAKARLWNFPRVDTRRKAKYKVKGGAEIVGV